VALCTGAGAVALLVACHARYPARPVAIAAASLAVAVWLPAPRGSGLAELHLIDVGQGDAIALRTPRGRWVLVDAGPAWRGGDAGRSTVVPYIARRGGTVEALVLSHPHTDHVGGAAAVVHALRPRFVYDAAFVGTAPAYAAVLGGVRTTAGRWQRARAGDSLEIDGLWITFLAPDSAWTASQREANDASIVVRVRHGAVSALLVGDAERAEEEWLVRRYGGSLEATVLKVGHHGSRTSSSADFLDAVRPAVAMISVGALNSFGHPSPETLQALASRRVRLLRTDQDGTVVLETDGRTLHVRTGGRRWEVPLSGR
jgi:competence protein ComEC